MLIIKLFATCGIMFLKGLRHDNAGHRLYVIHTYRHSSFGLASVYGKNASAHGFGHICACVYRDDNERGNPNTAVSRELNFVKSKIRQSVENENCLEHHRRAAEEFHIYAHYGAYERYKTSFDCRIVFRIRNGIKNSADKSDDTACKSGDKGKYEGVAYTCHIGRVVLRPYAPYRAPSQ